MPAINPRTPEQAPAVRPAAFETAAMVAGAILVAVGVLFLDWPPFTVMALFWLENVAIGVANWFRLLLIGLRLPLRQVLNTIVMLAFFPVHYGIFCVAHAEILVSIFGAIDSTQTADAGPARLLAQAVGEPLGGIALAAMVITVALDNVRWWRARRDQIVADDLGYTMFAPYPRIVILHVTIVVGGFLLVASAAPAALVLLLVALKLAFDLYTARRPLTFGRAREGVVGSRT